MGFFSRQSPVEKKYDKIYETPNYFGDGSNSGACEFISSKFPKNASILDFGAGQGRFCLPLAKKGYNNIECVDLSGVGLSQIFRVSENENLGIRVQQCNFLDYKFEKEFDCVMSMASLQFLKNSREFSKVISNIKKNTKNGGYNIISMPVAKYGLFNKDYSFEFDDFKDFEKYYNDWKIIFLDEFPIKLKNGTNYFALMIAQKV